jgi:CxxC motif-containing protein
MSENKTIVCIVCPMGCQINVSFDGKEITGISGNSCIRGKEYAIAECMNPVRTLTSTVRVVNGELPVAPVKTNKPIPKHLITCCMSEINHKHVKAPVFIGDIVIKNILGTNADVIATADIMPCEGDG